MNFREKRYPAVVDLSDPEQVKELGPGSNEEPFFIDVATCGFCYLLFPVTNATLVYNKQDEGKILICQVCAYFTKLTKGNIAKKTGCLGWNNSAQLKKFIQYFELLYDLDNIQPPDGVLGYFCKRLRCNICQKPVSLHETMEQHAEEHHHKSGDVWYTKCPHGCEKIFLTAKLPAHQLRCRLSTISNTFSGTSTNIDSPFSGNMFEPRDLKGRGVMQDLFICKGRGCMSVFLRDVGLLLNHLEESDHIWKFVSTSN